VSAAFISAPGQLSVTISGQGTVTSNPAGISCPSTCSADFGSGKVTLTATAAAGYTFSGFSGGCSGTNCRLSLTAGQSVSVTATFTAKAPDITSINHIIVFLQENRSFDHYFGQLAQYWQAKNYPQATNGTTFDGLPANASNVDPQGATVTAYNLQSSCTENPSPSWNESHVDRNQANPIDSKDAPMDGFVHTAAGDAAGTGLFDVLGHRAIGYFTGDQLNYYYFMASNFATSDRWFSPAMSRTHINRMYLLAGTSAGHAYPLGDTQSPALSNRTIFEELQDNGISWKIYVHPDSSGCTTASCLEPKSYISQFTYGQYVVQNLPNQIAPTSQLMADIQNGTLPQVAFIEPAGYVGLDEHPTGVDVSSAPNVQVGASYAASIMNALMSSVSWKDSALIFSYDEGGGFYDHVPPQPAVPPDAIQFPTDLIGPPKQDICYGDQSDQVCGFYFTGFRVPLIVVSPFTKKNYVSHTVMDYTAILKFIETRFNLPSLTARDQAEPDMTEFFDFASAPWATPPSPPKQLVNLPCQLGALNAVTISPNPAPAGGQATVTLSLSHTPAPNLGDMSVALSASSSGVVAASAVIPANSTSTSFNITVPTGITSLTITGTIGGIPVSGTVPVQ
jgi:phospholipase C